MSEAEDFLQQAQVAFRLANGCSQQRSVERYAEMGRDYLRRSHEAAAILEPSSNRPSWWQASH